LEEVSAASSSATSTIECASSWLSSSESGGSDGGVGVGVGGGGGGADE